MQVSAKMCAHIYRKKFAILYSMQD